MKSTPFAVRDTALEQAGEMGGNVFETEWSISELIFLILTKIAVGGLNIFPQELYFY